MPPNMYQSIIPRYNIRQVTSTLKLKVLWELQCQRQNGAVRRKSKTKEIVFGGWMSVDQYIYFNGLYLKRQKIQIDPQKFFVVTIMVFPPKAFFSATCYGFMVTYNAIQP